MLAVDTVLQGRYRILRQIEKGGMGTVYEAVDLRLLTSVALKEARLAGEHLRRQFEREAQMLAHLRHPALTKVFDHFTEGDGQFLVMEYVPGMDLSEMMRKKGHAFHPLEVVAWADQLLDALEYLHTREPSVVHRDIKPSNLKLSDRGQIVLLDFGLAKGGEMPGASAESSVGGYTLNYAPLEQIQGAGTGPRSDLYSLGATLYHLLANEKPADALTRATQLIGSRSDPLIPVTRFNEHVTNEFAAFLTRSMALRQEDRPFSATEMRRLLREASATLGDLTLESDQASLPPSQRAQLNYWMQFCDFLSRSDSSLRMEVPKPQNFLSVLAGRFFHLSAFANADTKQVGVNLCLSGPDAEGQFNKLSADRDGIERELGYALCWDANRQMSKYMMWVGMDDADPLDARSSARQYEWLRERLEGMLRVCTPRLSSSPADGPVPAESAAAPRLSTKKIEAPLSPSPSPNVTDRYEPAAFDVGEYEPATAVRPNLTPAEAARYPRGRDVDESMQPRPGRGVVRFGSRPSKWPFLIPVAAVVLFATIAAIIFFSGRRQNAVSGAQESAAERPDRVAHTATGDSTITDLKVTNDLTSPQSPARMNPDSVIYLLAKINSKGNVRVRGRLLVERVAGNPQGMSIPGADTTVELPRSGTATFKFSPIAGWGRGSYTAEVILLDDRGTRQDVRVISFVIS